MNTKEIKNKCFPSENTMAQFRQKLAKVDAEFKVATTEEEAEQIELFWDKYYEDIFPETCANKPDPYKRNGILFYITSNSDRLNHDNEIIATITFAFDCPAGLPDQDVFTNQIEYYRQANLSYFEVGHFLVSKGSWFERLSTKGIRFIYDGAMAIGIDYVVGLYKASSCQMFANTVGANIVNADTGKTFGGKYTHGALEWAIKQTSPVFIAATQGSVKPQPRHLGKLFENYSNNHKSITPKMQQQVYLNAGKLVYGKVLDVGCGAAKAALDLVTNANVSSYLGLDFSQAMAAKAQQTLAGIGHADFQVQQGQLIDVEGLLFDSVICLFFLQFCNDRAAILKQINSLMVNNGTMVMAVPNPDQNLALLEQVIRKEFPASEELEQFIQCNYELAEQTVEFMPMHQLQQELVEAGFIVVKADQRHYCGGVNLVEVKKVASGA